jgi:hypothetical protein
LALLKLYRQLCIGLATANPSITKERGLSKFGVIEVCDIYSLKEPAIRNML